MKKHLYILIEAVLSMFVWFLIVGLCFVEFNMVIAALASIGSLYFIHKIIVGVRLFVDIIEGPKEKCSIFMGNLGTEHLDFFWKINFSNVYFNDEILTKNYLLFDDAFSGELRQEDRITVVYYKRSRIILQLY
ncbi:MAG: hypothetical protein ACI4GB_05055 [Acutalibacteraceae bacterium]